MRMGLYLIRKRNPRITRWFPETWGRESSESERRADSVSLTCLGEAGDGNHTTDPNGSVFASHHAATPTPQPHWHPSQRHTGFYVIYLFTHFPQALQNTKLSAKMVKSVVPLSQVSFMKMTHFKRHVDFLFICVTFSIQTHFKSWF